MGKIVVEFNPISLGGAGNLGWHGKHCAVCVVLRIGVYSEELRRRRFGAIDGARSLRHGSLERVARFAGSKRRARDGSAGELRSVCLLVLEVLAPARMDTDSVLRRYLRVVVLPCVRGERRPFADLYDLRVRRLGSGRICAVPSAEVVSVLPERVALRPHLDLDAHVLHDVAEVPVGPREVQRAEAERLAVFAWDDEHVALDVHRAVDGRGSPAYEAWHVAVEFLVYRPRETAVVAGEIGDARINLEIQVPRARQVACNRVRTANAVPFRRLDGESAAQVHAAVGDEPRAGENRYRTEEVDDVIVQTQEEYVLLNVGGTGSLKHHRHLNEHVRLILRDKSDSRVAAVVLVDIGLQIHRSRSGDALRGEARPVKSRMELHVGAVQFDRIADRIVVPRHVHGKRRRVREDRRDARLGDAVVPTRRLIPVIAVAADKVRLDGHVAVHRDHTARIQSGRIPLQILARRRRFNRGECSADVECPLENLDGSPRLKSLLCRIDFQRGFRSDVDCAICVESGIADFKARTILELHGAICRKRRSGVFVAGVHYASGLDRYGAGDFACAAQRAAVVDCDSACPRMRAAD